MAVIRATQKSMGHGVGKPLEATVRASETGAPLAPLAPRTERLTMAVSSRMQQGWRELGHQCLDLTHRPPSCWCSHSPVPASSLISRVPLSLLKKRVGWRGQVHLASKGNFRGATTEGEVTQPWRGQESGRAVALLRFSPPVCSRDRWPGSRPRLSNPQQLQFPKQGPQWQMTE